MAQVSVADSGWEFKAEDGQGLPVFITFLKMCSHNTSSAICSHCTKFATRCSPMPMGLAFIDWQLRGRKMTGQLFTGWRSKKYHLPSLLLSLCNTQEEALKLGTPAAIDHIYPSAVPLKKLSLFCFLLDVQFA